MFLFRIGQLAFIFVYFSLFFVIFQVCFVQSILGVVTYEYGYCYIHAESNIQGDEEKITVFDVAFGHAISFDKMQGDQKSKPNHQSIAVNRR